MAGADAGRTDGYGGASGPRAVASVRPRRTGCYSGLRLHPAADGGRGETENRCDLGPVAAASGGGVFHLWRAVERDARQPDHDGGGDLSARGTMIDSLINPSDSPERQTAKLLTIAQVLMRRVEQITDDSGAAYAQFQRAALLEDQVRERTRDLERALDLLNASNGALAEANPAPPGGRRQPAPAGAAGGGGLARVVWG